MSNYVENLNDLIVAKKEIKSIIKDAGVEPGDIFSYYPSYIRAAIAGGGVIFNPDDYYTTDYIDENFVSYSYLAEALSDVDVDLDDYPTFDDISDMGYITAADVPEVDLSTYVTYTYLYTYVADALSDVDVDLDDYPTFDDISGMGYITESDVSNYGYITMGDVSACGYITAADVPEVNLSYVLSTYNLRYINEIPFYDGKKLYLLNSGLDVADTGSIFPQTYSYSQIVTYLNRGILSWIGGPTMKNYVEGRIAELESSSVTPSYLAANYVSYSYAYNTFVSYAYLGDLEQISEYILGSGSSSAPENVYATKVELASYATKTELGAYATKVELGSYVSKIELSNASYVTSSDLPIIDENLIPKSTDTYTLGDSSNYYHTLYSNRIQGNSSVNIRTNGNNRLTITGTAMRPMQQNYNLGSSDYPFATAYISNIYNFIWTGTSAEYALLDNYTTYQLYLIQEA